MAERVLRQAHFLQYLDLSGGAICPDHLRKAAVKDSWYERTLRAECRASVQIDVTEARHMDMRSYKKCGGRAGQSAEQMSLPRDAGLARKNAPEN